MLKQIIHTIHRPAYQSLLHPLFFRRTLRNTRTHLPSEASGATVQKIRDETSELEKIELELFGVGDKIGMPVQNESYKTLQQEKPLKMLRHQKTMFKSADKIERSKTPVTESSPIVKDTILGLEYTKLKLSDPLLAKLILAAKSRKQRDKENQIIVEGRKLIVEALECGCNLRYILFSEKDQLALIRESLKSLKGGKILKVPKQDLRVWSTLTTFPGILAIFDRPENDSNFLIKGSTLPISVICDNIREPNNLGSIIRSCAAIPCAEVIVLKGCCDPWETKALRGGCGGQFRVKIHYGLTWDEIEKQLPNDYRVFIAENKVDRAKKSEGQSLEVYSNIQVSDSHNVLVIGGESHGISEEAYGFLAKKGNGGTCLHIPLAEGVESLNTAAAVTLILFEMRKLLSRQ